MSIISQVDILDAVEQISKERRMGTETVFEVLEEALRQDALQTYGPDRNISVQIDRLSGKISIGRIRTVVENVSDILQEISLDQAHIQKPGLKEGDSFFEEISLNSARRSNAQNVKRFLSQKIRAIELQKQYDEFVDKVGTIVSGNVKRLEFGHIILDVMGAEALLRRDQMIPKEKYRIGDRVRVYIEEVVKSEKTPQVITSRTHPGFLASLMTQEVPEIYDGLIEIKGVVRDPGSRAKVAVFSGDDRMRNREISACVGVRGARIEIVKNELQGEKIDVVLWSQNIPTFIANALVSAKVMKVVMDPLSDKVEVVVPGDKQNIAIGRGGQNIRLVSKLTNTSIDILTEEQEAKRRSTELSETVNLLARYLDLDDLMARFFAMEGFESLESICDAPSEELAELDGMNEDIAQELKERAKEALPIYRKDVLNLLAQRGAQQDLLDLHIPIALLKILPDHSIVTLKDFAGLSRDELQEIIPENLEISVDEIDAMILDARKKLFEEEA